MEVLTAVVSISQAFADWVAKGQGPTTPAPRKHVNNQVEMLLPFIILAVLPTVASTPTYAPSVSPSPAPTRHLIHTPSPTWQLDKSEITELFAVFVVLLAVGCALLIANRFGYGDARTAWTRLHLPTLDTDPQEWLNELATRYTKREIEDEIGCGIILRLPCALMTEKLFVWFGCIDLISDTLVITQSRDALFAGGDLLQTIAIVWIVGTVVKEVGLSIYVQRRLKDFNSLVYAHCAINYLRIASAASIFVVLFVGGLVILVVCAVGRN